MQLSELPVQIRIQKVKLLWDLILRGRGAQTFGALGGAGGSPCLVREQGWGMLVPARCPLHFPSTPSGSKQTAGKENPQRELLSQIWVDKGGEVKT